MRALYIVAAAVLAASGLGMAWQPKEPTPAKETGRVNDTTHDAVKALGFLQGTWRGTMHGDPVEEIWSAPSADSIVGAFRWMSEGKTTMFELLSIKAEEGAAVLRLRHFGGDFVPWKGECDGVAAMKATTVEKSRVVFTNASEVGGVASCEYHCTTPDTLKIVVTFKADRSREPLNFELARVK